MPVLIEANTIVINARALVKKFKGGWFAFKEIVPNTTLCSDSELVAVSFWNPDDLNDFEKVLLNNGLKSRLFGQARDFVTVVQGSGPMVKCKWLEYGTASLTDLNATVCVCSLSGGKQTIVATPIDWKYEHSLSAASQQVSTNQINDSHVFLRHENGIDVYQDRDTGEEVYVARSITKH